MKKSKFMAVLAITALLFVFTGCSGTSGNPAGGENPGDNNGNSTDTTTVTTGTKTVGSNGGSVIAGDNVQIKIPAGALNGDTAISVKYFATDDVPAGFLGGVEFGPDGTVFNSPVEVTMQLIDEPENEKVSIFCYDEEEDMWYFVTEAECTDKTAKFKLNHFSSYKAIDTRYEKYSRFETEVRNGKAAGLSDAQIFDNYMDYLLNQEKLMDKYIMIGGYWFKPCGVSANGDYVLNDNEGDPNYLRGEVGKSNEIKKDVTGVIGVGGGISSSMEFLKNKKKTIDRQDSFYVCVTVYYEMIEPTIEVTAAPSTSVRAGDKTMIWVFCYYEDLVMPNYELTLPFELKHFSTSTNKITTNSLGMANFMATGLDAGYDRIKVMFRYEDAIFAGMAGGVYAAGYIDLSCDKPVKLSGKINEKTTYTFDKTPIDGYDYTEQEGVLEVGIEYDIDADLYIDELTGIFDGDLFIKNLTVNTNSTPIKYHWSFGEDSHGTITQKIWATNKIEELSDEKFAIVGTLKDGVLKFGQVDTMYFGLNGSITLSGTTNYSNIGVDHGESVDINDVYQEATVVLLGTLYDIKCEDGTTTVTKKEMKDSFTTSVISTDEYFYGIELGRDQPEYALKELPAPASTTQTITVTLPVNDEAKDSEEGEGTEGTEGSEGSQEAQGSEE